MSATTVGGVNGVAVNRLAQIKARPGVRTERRTITPAEARVMLESSRTTNRRLNPALVKQIATDMQTGRFVFNGESVIISDEGDILDAHHRLHACVQADTSFDTVVVTGVPASAMPTIDTGDGRDRSDVLEMAGHKYANDLGTLARWCWHAETDTLSQVGRSGRQVGFTNQELLAVVRRHPGLEEAVRRSAVVQSKFKPCSRSMYAFALYWFARYDRDTAEAFVAAVADGEGLSKGDAVYALRQRMLNDAMNKTRMPTNEKLAVMVKAWRAFATGTQVRQLRWADDEPFPSCDPTE